MNCPTWSVKLQMAERQGVEIDYCPQCRGVWLDRGELDKIIERSIPPTDSNPSQTHEYENAYSRDDYHPDDRRQDDRHYDKNGKRRKRSFLGDLFDFGD